MRRNFRNVAAALLPALLGVGIASAQVKAPAESLAQVKQDRQDGRLIAIELAVPLCLEKHPDEGKLVEAAWAGWGTKHAEDLKAYRARLAANPDETAYAREKIRSALANTITGPQGAAVCANAATLIEGLGGPLDPGAAAGMYHQQMIRAEALLETCGKLHPSIADDIARDKRTWETNEAAIQKLARSHMEAKAREAGSAVPQLVADIKRVWTTIIEEQEANGTAESYCRDAFAKLAAGRERQVNPDLYEALDRALEAN